MFFKQEQKGFTLLELAVVIGIMAVISSMVYANYHDINKKGNTLAASKKMINEIRIAQYNSTHKIGYNGQHANGWGIKIDDTNDRYTIFADFDNSKEYDYPVKLLIHGDEWSSGTTFTESSSTGHTITLSGAATQVSSSGKPTGTSGYWSFDGASGYLSIPDSNDWNFGSGDFTIDGWVYTSGISSNWTIIANSFYTVGQNDNYVLRINSATNYLSLVLFDGTVFVESVVSSVAVPVDQWVHVAIVRSSGAIKLYVNGANDGTLVSSEAYGTGSSNGLYIANTQDLDRFFDGYIDELRIVKGGAMWKSNFTVPSKEHDSDVEKARQVTLLNGVTIGAINGDAGTLSASDVYFSVDDHKTYQDGLVSSVNLTAEIKEADGTVGKTININSFGLAYDE